MARGAKKSFDEQLEQIDLQISKAQDRIDNLNQEKENILCKKRESEIGELYQYLHENGLTVSDVLIGLELKTESLSA